jgi:dynein heavy chain
MASQNGSLAASQDAGEREGMKPHSAGSAPGNSAKLPKLPTNRLVQQSSAEYSTLRFSKQQPSARFGTWDARKAVGSLDFGASTLSSPSMPLSARGHREKPLSSERERGAPLSARASTLNGTKQAAQTLSPRPGRGGGSDVLDAWGPAAFSSAAAEAGLFTLDQEELNGFRLGNTNAAAAPGAAGSSGAAPNSGRPAIRAKEEESQGKLVDQTPAHLLVIKNMYASKDKKPDAPDEPGLEDPDAIGDEAMADKPDSKNEDMQTTMKAAGGDSAEEMNLDIQGQDEVDEDEALRRELMKLRTGEDVIAFFAKNGSNTPVKFVYCRRRQVTDENGFRPYDLEVIPEMVEINKSHVTSSGLGEHFTISATGVVYVCPGQQSEYMSLGDWMHQCLMYSVLTSMNFFKFYIHGKVFSWWRLHTRYTVYCHHRQRLARRLFLAKPLFVQPLVRIHAIMHEVESVKVMSIGTNVYNLSDFGKEQAAMRSNTGSGAAKELEQRHDGVVAVMDRLVQTVNQSTEVSYQVDELTAVRPKMRSMVQEKKEARDNARRFQLAKHDQGMLGDCVRLVDYMLQACLVKVVINASIEFFQRLESSSKMFSISVSFGEAHMVFEPGLDDFLDVLSSLWRGTIQVVNTVPSFLSVRQYDPYVTVQNHQTVESILLRNREYNQYTVAVRERIQSDIMSAQRFSDKNFAVFRRIHEYGLQWNEEEYAAKFQPSAHEELARDMFLMREFQDDLDKFKPHHNVGIIVVDGKNLRASLTPIPERSLVAMKRMLTDIARKKCLGVLQKFDSANKILDERPKVLTAYADYVKAYNDIRNLEGEMDESREEVESMYQLLRQYNVRVTGDDQLQMEVLQQKGNDFTDKKVIEAHTFIKEKREEMIEGLGGVSSRVEEDAREVAEMLNRGQCVAEDAILTPESVLEELQVIHANLQKLEEKAATFVEYQGLFQTPQAFEFQDVENAKQLFAEKQKLWNLVHEWTEMRKEWTTKEFSKINVEDMNKKVLECSKAAFQLTRSLDGDDVATKIRSMIDEWKNNMPTIIDLGNPAMKPRHWARIFKAISMNSSTITILSLTNHNVFDVKDLVSEISGTASGEYALEQSVDKVTNAWQDLPLPVMNHRNQKDLWILADVSECITQLEDHSVQVQTMLGSRFVTGIRDKVEMWEQKIRLGADVIDEWLQVQRSWMYLESIFNAEDIQKQLPTESAKFKAVDKFWRETLRKVRQSYRNAMDAFHIPGLLPALRSNNETLDQIQKSLEAYLETKRAAFPRFYFLSDDELLSILSQTRNPEAVNEHICKAFDSINRVTFTQDKKQEIVDMSDMIKETVVFKTPITTQGAVVEKWLTDLEIGMVKTLSALTGKAVMEYPEDGSVRKDWLFAGYPQQAVLCVDQIMWTKCAEDALNQMEAGNQNAMLDNIAFTKKQLDHSVGLVRLDLNKLQRVEMGAIIVLDVHGITVLENVSTAKCKSVNDFDWSKQLRYYWILQDMATSTGHMVCDDCVVKQTIASFKYSHEFLGNTPRLVVTPLTDKCYMTLTGAMHLSYGGAPAGPAGTGKTETTKDLGKALAVPIVVFNCSDGLDYKIMGRFFSGLAQSGSWACFDEFNRIQVEVLSVIAQQMLTITQAIRSKKEIFEFVGREIPLNPRFAVYITMNPGYAGRAELPDNLKSLFRPVAMMVPDYALIAEIILYSEGFGNATHLARKMVSLYSLSSEQLSKQDHYDFGMRAVKSVLVMAGQLKRKYPDLEENITLIRALRDSNVPKFLSFDLPLFSGIITDLYPEATVPYVDYGNLQKEIENQIRLQRLQILPAFVGKIIQLLETQLVRHGVMVVGLTCIGKSTNINVLAKSLTQLRQDNSPDAAHQLTKTFSLNPKSVTMEELYGSFNQNTGEWSDGLVSILVREAVSDTSDSKKWVIFDGPVDAIWIENMNTVLDDNKMLCLANGERIKLPPTMTMLFEVQDLTVASPATVSRCGMVYLEPIQLGWKPFVLTWAENFKERYPLLTDDLRKWAIYTCEKALPFIREECKEAPGIPSVDGNLVSSFLRMLTTFISPKNGFPQDSDDNKSKKADSTQKALARLFCAFSAVWSLGANLHESSRTQFQDFLKPILQNFCPEVAHDKHLNLYQACVNVEDASFTNVANIVPEFFFDDSAPFFNILVPTLETTLQRLLVENLALSGYHTLFSGETGVGKSVGVQQFMVSAGESFTVATANFSAQTSAANVVDFLENRLERKRKNLLGAPPGTVMLLFVDDINMPMLEKYGAQPPIELLRQVIDYKGFYDRKKLFWKGVADTQLIAACGQPGGGRMEVTPRMFRHFNMFWMTALPMETMNRILSSIMSGWLMMNKPELEDFAKPIVGATVDMFFVIISDLLPTPQKCHYTFNLRDPAKMLQGLLMVHVKSSLKDKDALMRLWLHETCRQFRDRLINEEDRDWFNVTISSCMEKHLGETWPVDKFANLSYGDFFDRAEKIYVEAGDEKKLVETFNDYLEEYNSQNASKMNLVFFKDAQQHLCRVARVVRQPRGNALLVGVSGVGRKSMARMSAHMAEFTCYSVEITRNYGSNDFREDIKTMMMDVIKNDGRGLIFLFSDTQIVKETFLEDINNVLNTGEVPNLFAPEEAEQIVGIVRPLAKAAGLFDARDVIWAHFVQTIRESLHIVLAFSPVGEGFRGRCRQFPSLINCATIDWYDSWPDDALVSVANRYYQVVPAELEIGHMLKQLSQMSCVIHASTSKTATRFYEKLRRMTYTTPTSYLELIKLFTELLGKKKGELQTKLNRYKVGAQRLDETKTIVDKLKVDLTQLQPVIEQGKKDTAELIIQVDKEEAVAKEKQIACEVDEKEATEAATIANDIKAECQRELDEALPEYYSAIKSLDALDKKDIQEVKSFAKPPPLVEVVLQAVCLLMGKKENWDEGKKLMNDSGFLQSLRDYDKDALALNLKLTGKLQRYVKRDDFKPEAVKKVSGAAMTLCLWVRAMDVYARVARSIEPKKEKLKSSEAMLATAEGKLATKKAELKAVQDKVAALQLQLMRARSKAEKLEAEAETCTVKLGRAEKLLLGLGDESVRWEAASKVLEKNLKFVVGDIILAAGFVAYVGPFTAEFRQDLLKLWLQSAEEIDMKADPAWKCADILCDPAEVREWIIRSLPSDDLSVENGIFVTRGRRWPLMIDPQGQGNRWIRNFKKENNIGIIKLSTPNFLRTLEMGIREGSAILLENVEESLDPSLEPVLLKQTFKKGGQLLLRIGSEDVPYNEDFQLFITTKMANPHYLPEICIKVTVINFTVTLDGLEDQLVSDVVAHERPDLSTLRADLVVQIAADKTEMDRLEQLILKLLSEAGADLLADERLIVTLDQSKQTGNSCKERMATAEKSMVQIDVVTEKLRPVATRASIIYFVVADLAEIDPMYQYSLQFFCKSLSASATEDSKERGH